LSLGAGGIMGIVYGSGVSIIFLSGGMAGMGSCDGMGLCGRSITGCLILSAAGTSVMPNNDLINL
jgi:hypothetical protein